MATGTWTDAGDTTLNTTLAALYAIKNTIDCSEVASNTDYTGAGGDIIQALSIPAGTLVKQVIANITTAQTAGTDTVTFDVGITGGDVDGFIDSVDAESTGVTIGAGAYTATSFGKYFATADTIDILIINSGSTDMTDDMVVELTAICIDL